MATIDVAVKVAVPVSDKDMESMTGMLRLLDWVQEVALTTMQARFPEGTAVVQLSGSEIFGVQVWVDPVIETAVAAQLRS